MIDMLYKKSIHFSRELQYSGRHIWRYFLSSTEENIFQNPDKNCFNYQSLCMYTSLKKILKSIESLHPPTH